MNAPQQHSPDDLINDLLERRANSIENFRAAVEGREEAPYLGASQRALIWCAVSEDVDVQFDRGTDAIGLLEALGTGWSEPQFLELMYPLSVLDAIYKPSAVVAGANARFRYTSVEEDFGRTIGGIREMIHAPLKVAEALVFGSGLREWGSDANS